MKSNLVLSCFAFALSGCASQPPEWIMKPTIPGGFAATECVRDSGNFSLDRQIAVAKARAEVAKQFELRVAAMDKTYARMTEETTAPAKGDKPGQARSVQTAFESVSKQVAEQTLSGLTPTRVEYVDLQDQHQLCAEVAVDKSAARQAYDQVVQASGNKVDAAANEALYKEFSAGTESGTN
jgi:hypothetical protein